MSSLDSRLVLIPNAILADLNILVLPVIMPAHVLISLIVPYEGSVTVTTKTLGFSYLQNQLELCWYSAYYTKPTDDMLLAGSSLRRFGFGQRLSTPTLFSVAESIFAEPPSYYSITASIPQI